MSKPIPTMAIWASFLSLLGCSSVKDKMPQNQVVNGPLTIYWEVESTASWAWFTNGGKPGGKITTSYFSVKHKDKPVTVMTSDGKATSFWQAWFLADALKPTAIVGTHSMYLLTDEDGQLKTKALNEQEGNFGSYQWLDSDKGQPGQSREVYISDDSKSSRFLSGGRYLLINKKTVLDSQTLASYPIDVNSSELVQQLGEYNAFDSRAVGLSPARTQVVLIGYRRNPTTSLSEYALVAIDFVKNEAYAVPFDRTTTQFFSIWDATPTWMATYFDWTTNENGKEKLSVRHFKQLPYWKSRWSYDQGTNLPKEYELNPVLPSMIASFLDCVRKQYLITDLKTEDHGEIITNTFTVNGTMLTLFFIARDRRISLHCDDKQLLKSIGENFDKELAKGNFQKEFSRFDYD